VRQFCRQGSRLHVAVTAKGVLRDAAHFNTAFFTVNIPHGFTVHEYVQLHLRPQN
jgi:hypothetical protein